MSIAQFVLPHNSVPISPINCQFCLSTTEVHTQQWISILHLQYDKVFCITFRQLGDRSLVEYKAIVLGRHELQTGVAFSALGQWLKPSPAISTKAVLRLLAPRSIKPIPTDASSTENISNDIHMPFSALSIICCNKGSKCTVQPLLTEQQPF